MSEHKKEAGSVVPEANELNLLLAATKSSAAGGFTNDNVAKLLEIMLLREVRQGEKERGEEIAKIAKEDAQKRDSHAYQQDMIRRQSTCKHLKGAKTRKANQAKDFNVFMHTFPDKKTYIKCNSCSAKWRPDDTKEFYLRGKQSLINHTKIGWAEAREMAEQSSNSGSSSEIPLVAVQEVEYTKTTSGEDAANVQY